MYSQTHGTVFVVISLPQLGIHRTLGRMAPSAFVQVVQSP